MLLFTTILFCYICDFANALHNAIKEQWNKIEQHFNLQENLDKKRIIFVYRKTIWNIRKDAYIRLRHYINLYNSYIK